MKQKGISNVFNAFKAFEKRNLKYSSLPFQKYKFTAKMLFPIFTNKIKYFGFEGQICKAYKSIDNINHELVFEGDLSNSRIFIVFSGQAPLVSCNYYKH